MEVNDDGNDDQFNSVSMNQLFHNVESDLYSHENHKALIEKLKQLPGMEDLVENARTTMSGVVALTEDMWLDWINDNFDLEKDYYTVQETMQTACRECPSANLWEKYGQFLLELYGEKDNLKEDYPFLRDDMILTELGFGVETTAYYLPDSHKVWNVYMDFLTLQYKEGLNSSINLQRLKDMYLQRLSIPHSEIDDTFSKYSTFITTYFNDNYEQEMVAGNKIKSQTKKIVDYRDRWEVAVKADSSLPMLAEYIQWEQKRPKKYQNSELVKALFERALLIHPFVQEVWDDYILYLCDKVYSNEIVNSVVDRAVKACPWSGTLWAHKIRLSEVQNADADEMNDIASQLNGIPHFNSDDGIEDWKIVKSSWLSYLYRLYLEIEDDEYKDYVVSECEKSIDRLVNSEKKSISMDLEQIIIEILTKLDVTKLAKSMWFNVSKYLGTKSEFWIKWFQWEQIHGSYQSAMEVINSAMDRHDIDWPERITDALVEFERINGTAYSAQHSIVRSRQKLKSVAEKRMRETQQIQDEGVEEADPFSSNVVESDRKRSHSEVSERNETDSKKKPKSDGDNKGRDREHNCVVVTNLLNSTKESIKSAFSDCGNIKSVYTSVDNTAASIEFTTHDAFLSALTKDKKEIEGQEINVSSGEGTTLWVTNFPAVETEQSLSKEFSNYGQVLSIRFPSLKFNNSRRFCYIQFTSADSAKNAANSLDGKPFKESGQLLVVKISDPSKKQERSGPVSEERELFIKGIDFKAVTQKQIEAEFQQYGKIEKLHLPMSDKAKKGEKLHDGYGFITFSTKEEAANALEMNGKKLGNRNLNVSIASKTAPSNKKATQGDSQKILRVNNIADTVNQEQLKQIFEEVGPVTSVMINPKQGTANIKFGTASDVGKAEMKFDGYELAGKKLYFGPLRQSSTMFVPRNARKK